MLGARQRSETDGITSVEISLVVEWEAVTGGSSGLVKRQEIRESETPVTGYTIIVGVEAIDDPFGMIPAGSVEHEVMVSEYWLSCVLKGNNALLLCRVEKWLKQCLTVLLWWNLIIARKMSSCSLYKSVAFLRVYTSYNTIPLFTLLTSLCFVPMQ